MRTYVIAPNQKAARDDAIAAGLQPFSRDVVLVSQASRLHGHTIRASDNVIISPSWDGPIPARLLEALEICRFVGELE